MGNLKAVCMAILIYIIAPLVVRYVELNYLTTSVYETRTAQGEPGISGTNR